jgi:hypothetical protein
VAAAKTDLRIFKSFGNWHLTRSWSGTERLCFIFKYEKWLYSIYADQVNCEDDCEFWINFFKGKPFLALEDIKDLESALNFILTREPVR